MLWQTLWALALGFTLSGATQAFVTRREMEKVLGDHRPAAILRATALGMASSSCSYAASAMARSLFRKGADFLTAVVFMIASTNLVLELGIVLAALLGWQFLAAEAVGGPIMIVLFVMLGAVLIPRALVARARRVEEDENQGGGAHEHCHDSPGADGRVEAGQTWGRRITTRRRWAEAAQYTLADLRMVRRELVVGYLVAGLLTVAIPDSAWHVLFVQGHGAWSDIENALVGPVIAFASFVCSIGNVPLAAALWHGGISFGGVVSFVFADLVAAPLVLIYRRYYGTALTLRLIAVLGMAMAAAGLAVGALFSWAGLVPGTRPAHVVPLRVTWDATTVLNIVGLVVVATLFLLRRSITASSDAPEEHHQPVADRDGTDASLTA